MVMLIYKGSGLGGVGPDLSFPSEPIAQMGWIQGAAYLLEMFVFWLFSILIVASYAQGSHRNAAACAVVFVRVSIVMAIARVLFALLIKLVYFGQMGLVVGDLVTSLPILLIQIALLIAADFYFSAIRRNAAV